MPTEFEHALISAQQLKDALNDANHLLIIDLCSDDHFSAGHIPGAVHVNPSQLSVGNKPAPGELPCIETLQSLFQNIGIDANKDIIVYDDAGSSWAGRMIWTLELCGIEARLLNGGRSAWEKAGFDFCTAVSSVQISDIQINIDRSNIADMNEVLKSLDNENVQVWDARSRAEYSGEKVLAERGGHIPSAIHLEWTDLTDEEGYILNKAALERILEDKGIDANKTIITHCQTHRRSGLTWFVAKKLLGFAQVKAYPGSWSEWGNSAHCPIEKDA